MPKGEGARKSKMLGKAIETDVQSVNDKAVNTEKGNSTNAEISNSVNTKDGSSINTEKGSSVTTYNVLVSLTIKVPKAYRQHWQVEAKKKDTSVTSLIVDALSKELGLP